MFIIIGILRIRVDCSALSIVCKSPSWISRPHLASGRWSRYLDGVAKRRKPTEPPAELEAVKKFFQAWGSQGGKRGGKLRWQGVPAEERSRIARKAARARWRKSGQ